MLKHIPTLTALTLPTILLLGVAVVAAATIFADTNQVFAWGPDFPRYNLGGDLGGDGRYGENIGIGEPPGPQSYDNGWSAGLQDAIYDHDNSLQYNPVGSCLPCHTEIYWHGFHAGYDKQWNSYTTNTEQTTNQGSSINIYGNNNYVSTNQYSSQSAGNILKSIGQGLCNLAGGCGSGSGTNAGVAPGPIQESYP